LTRIHQRTERGRCTFCKRRRGVAIAEQAAKGEPCPPGECEFAAEIAELIENRNRLRIVPKEKKRVQITEKQSRKINFVKRK
jgi:Na+-translocating ferredoxin:NAD+ oxidoreductase RNF subunit RnfB